MALSLVEALRYPSQREFISALGNARLDALRINFTRPQHGRSGGLLIAATNTHDGTGPKAFRWSLRTSDDSFEQACAMVDCSIDAFLHPFMT